MKSYELRDALVGLRPGGCMQPYLQSFAEEFIARDYALLVTRDYVRAATHFGRWMGTRGIALGSLTDAVVESFGRHRCECPGTSRRGQRPSRRYVARVRRFVDYLRSLGVTSAIVPSRAPTVPALLVAFREWMVQHRGLAEPTINRNESLVSRMLPALGVRSSGHRGHQNRSIADSRIARSRTVKSLRSRTLSWPFPIPVSAMAISLSAMAISSAASAR
jgi:hypothetical protein